MEVVKVSPADSGANGGNATDGGPFQRHDIREWSHTDRLTGVTERARVQTDQWAGDTHKYGKVVDSRDRQAPDGNLVQRQRKQLEVFSAHLPGGSQLQVVRTHTVSASRSRWSSASSATSVAHRDDGTPAITASRGFDGLQLALNPLDLSSQKSKANVGRSGSIGGRRPPSRPRSLVGKSDTGSSGEDTASSLARVSRLCHQIHEQSIKSAYGVDYKKTSKQTGSIPRQNGDGSVAPNSVIENDFRPEEKSAVVNGYHHDDLTKTKSSSIEDLYDKSLNEDPYSSEKSELFDDWRRSSKFRRSLQFPKQHSNTPSSPFDNGVKRNQQDLETGRRLNTAFRGNNVDLDALDQILKTISPSSSINSDNSADLKKCEKPEKEYSLIEGFSRTGKKSDSNKRHSFITAESLQEVRGRLRRLSSSPTKNETTETPRLEDDQDDGIVTEEPQTKGPVAARVRSYVFGMEAMLNGTRKPVIGTGSLESRTSSKKDGNGNNRSEDWYNRRKSYGFEKVHNTEMAQTNSIAFHQKSKVESSTDSGICRSTEAVVLPQNIHFDKNVTSFTENEKHVAIVEKNDTKNTIVNFGSNKNNINIKNIKLESAPDPFTSKKAVEELASIWNKRAVFNNRGAESEYMTLPEETTTLTVPVGVKKSTLSVNSKEASEFRRVETSHPVKNQNIMWNSYCREWPSASEDTNLKRHSIAVDEAAYMKKNVGDRNAFMPSRRSSVACEDDTTSVCFSIEKLDDDALQQTKKPKKVEFCKTEVHFAAESGRVNIVETDGKPPPTHNYRRRRRNNNVVSANVVSDETQGDLPIIRFGDTSYEKQLFSLSDSEQTTNKINVTSNLQSNSYITKQTITPVDSEDEIKNESENDIQPRGILKNKPVKPKPYHLGENIDFTSNDNNDDEETKSPWGVRLRPVQNEGLPMWRSTVTLKNTSYDTQHTSGTTSSSKGVGSDDESEYQKLLKSLKPTVNQKTVTAVSSTDQIAPPQADIRRSSWSVADRIRQVEDLQWSQTKGYSTKVNFGEGEATVVENQSTRKIGEVQHPTWPRKEDFSSKDEKRQDLILNKGLVVRIGKDDINRKINSKTNDTTTTTTKITIDMSRPIPIFNPIRLPRASLHSLKSTSLIMNTMNNNRNIEQNKIEQLPTVGDKMIVSGGNEQLAALRRLYEDAGDQSDDSERADEEVRSLMSADSDGVGSVVSGSWSRATAARQLKQFTVLQNSFKHQKYSVEGDGKSDSELRLKDNPNNSVNSNLIISDNSNRMRSAELVNIHSSRPKVSSITLSDTSPNIPSDKSQSSSPLFTKHMFSNKTNVIKNIHQLSSPSLVGTSLNSKNNKSSIFEIRRNELNLNNQVIENNYETKINDERRSQSPSKEVSYLNRKNTEKSLHFDSTRRSSSPTSGTSKSHLLTTYLGSAVPSPTDKTNKKLRPPSQSQTSQQNCWKLSSDKPDILMHNQNDSIRTYNQNKRITELKTKVTSSVNVNRKQKTHRDSPIPVIERPTSPVYENIDVLTAKKDNYLTRNAETIENETAILEELTRAADQILQAVNGYTDEESFKISTDDDSEGKKRKGQYVRKTADVLGTISETKSWNQKKTHTKIDSIQEKSVAINTKQAKPKIKPTSSTSSIESVTRECRRSLATQSLTKSNKIVNDEKTKKKSSSVDSKITKARRLQRASSREALLQSHDSSSEDVSISSETARKPRPIRKTKIHTSGSVTSKETVTSNPKTTEAAAKRSGRDCIENTNKNLIGLQEIRHKTAVSTIRSSAEKAATRHKYKRPEDNKRKTSTPKKENTVALDLITRNADVLKALRNIKQRTTEEVKQIS